MRVKALLAWLTILALVVGATFMVAAQAAQKYHEAPMLHELVLQGKLPPVDQRLPKNPKVVQPVDQIGKYGGTLLRVFTGPGDKWNYFKFSGGGLIRLTPKVEPNIVDQWKFEDGGKTLVLHFREGIKWSDGEPLTVDDFIYTWGLRLNPDIPQFHISSWMVDPTTGKVATLERVDDFTVKIHHYIPSPFMINQFKSEWSSIQPKHWLIQFDPRYNPSIKDYSLLGKKLSNRINPEWVGRPTLGAWMVTEYTPGFQLVGERNPYYWKVDTAGNQLPYIDRVVWQYVGSTDVIPLMAAAGKIDMQARKVRFSDYSFYKQNEKKGNYKVQVIGKGSLGPAIQFNYDCPDPVLRNLFRNKDFRIALSYATDRETISKVFFKGETKPWAYCQLPESPYYPGDKYAKMYTQYDPAKANAILDQLGLRDTDGNGIRNRADGKELSIVIDFSPKGGPCAYDQFVDLLSDQWKKVGIKVIPNPMDRALLWPRLKKNTYEAYLWVVDGALNFALGGEAVVSYWLPVAGKEKAEQPYKSAVKWYLSGGKEGEKPAEWIVQAQKLYSQMIHTFDPATQIALGKQIMALVTENCYQISTTTLVGLCIVSNKVGNVPDHWVYADTTRSEGVARPWQFFIK